MQVYQSRIDEAFQQIEPVLHQLNENRAKLGEEDLAKLEALTKNYVALRSNVDKLRESDSH